MNTERDTGDPPGLRSLLEHIKQARGFDFSGYKRASLERRIKRRMDALDVADYADYQDHLEVNPDEFTNLFDTILINVTGFFRDQPAWDYLAEDVVPKLIADTPEDRPIRVWSAACASGEEAYTAAMVLAEALGEPAFRRRVKVYATDVDEEALARARLAVYSRDSVKSIPEALREKYWEPAPGGMVFRPDLRRSVIFGRNDLVRDAPISRIDLLVSRNSLMYFTPETQVRILGHFNFSLTDEGYLFLGKSEMLLTHGDLFEPFNLKWRVFKKVQRAGIRDRLDFVIPPFRGGDEASERYTQLREAAADTSPVAQVVLDSAGFLAFANRAARELFSLGPADVGRPIQDLELSYRPIELRTGLARAADQQRVVGLGRTRFGKPGEVQRTLEVEITPLSADGSSTTGASVTFADVSENALLAEQFDNSKHQLETAYEELQSTVEELETTNEELQSTNDELEAMNDVQRERSDELDRLNMFLEGILGNLGVAVVVLDSDQRVQLWNGSATDLWGLRGDEVNGEHFLSLDMGLPVDKVRDSIRGALGEAGGPSTVSVQAVNRRGRRFECTVRALPLTTREGERYGVILLMSGLDGELQAGSDGSESS